MGSYFNLNVVDNVDYGRGFNQNYTTELVKQINYINSAILLYNAISPILYYKGY